jgi:sulfoxide reductase heme-binding subunit YedZ
MTAFTCLIALAATSNNWSIRTLGRGWGRLHMLVYLIATLGVVHFFTAVKSWPPRPFVYAMIIGALLAYRLVKLVLDQRRPLAVA